MIERACRHEIDQRGSFGLNAVHPAALDGTAKKNTEQQLDHLAGAAAGIAVPRLESGRLGLDRFGMRPATAKSLVNGSVVQQFIDNESVRVEPMTVAESFQSTRDRGNRLGLQALNNG